MSSSMDVDTEVFEDPSVDDEASETQKAKAEQLTAFYVWSDLIITCLKDLVNAKAVDIRDMYSLRGGWETWLQVELAIALQRGFLKKGGKFEGTHGLLSIGREEPVYAIPDGTGKGTKKTVSYKKNDLLFVVWEEQEYFDLSVSVELKCEGFHNIKAFRAAVLKDFEKISSGLIADEIKPCYALNIYAGTKEILTKSPYKKIPKCEVDLGTLGKLEFYAYGKDFITLDNLKGPKNKRMVLQQFLDATEMASDE